MNDIQRDNLILVCFAVIVAISLLLIPNHRVPSVQTDYEAHTVQVGETLSGIVESHHGSLKATQVENSNVIMPGQVIYIAIEGR